MDLQSTDPDRDRPILSKGHAVWGRYCVLAEPGASGLAVPAGAGMQVLLTPPRPPKAKAFTERRVATVRRECTDRILIINERHLHAILNTYTDHHIR